MLNRHQQIKKLISNDSRLVPNKAHRKLVPDEEVPKNLQETIAFMSEEENISSDELTKDDAKNKNLVNYMPPANELIPKSHYEKNYIYTAFKTYLE